MKRKIITALALIFILFGIGSWIAVHNMTKTTADLRSLIALHEIEDIRQELNLAAQKMMSYANAPAERFRNNIDDIVRDMNLFTGTIAKCQTCHHEATIQQELELTSSMGVEFETQFSLMLATDQESDWRKQNQKKTLLLGEQIIERVQGMVNRAAVTIRKQTDLAMQQIDHSYTVLLVTFGVTFLIAFFIAQYLTHKISRPIEALSTAAKQITAGSLGYQTDYKATSDFAGLIMAFNEMSRSLAEKELENKNLTGNLQQKVRELKMAQKQLVEAEKMTALGTFAGGIAHDFNNILCGIISNITLLKRRDDTSGEARSLLETIEKAGFRAASLIQQLLTFARQEVGEKIPLSINEHITNVLKLISNSLPPQIVIQMKLAEDLPAVLGDATRLEQVILNLVLNARDAMPDGGSLTITTRKVQLDEGDAAANPDISPGSYVAISLQDTGIGMNETVLARIFEPFFTTKPFGQGTGLGLAMVHGIIRGHHGACTVTSSLGHGTTFTIHLPVTDEKADLGRDKENSRIFTSGYLE